MNKVRKTKRMKKIRLENKNKITKTHGKRKKGESRKYSKRQTKKESRRQPRKRV